MKYTTSEILSIGTACLIENLGIVVAEQFISAVQRERFDYAKWQREYFDNVDPEAFLAAACAYDKAHPIALRGDRPDGGKLCVKSSSQKPYRIQAFR